MDKKQILINYFKDGIVDVSGNIKFIDTKLGLLVSMEALIMSALMLTRSGIYGIYVDGSCCIKVIIFLSISIYIITLIIALYNSYKCILARLGIPEKTCSLWYRYNTSMSEFKIQGNILSDTQISEMYLEELYTVNKIFAEKCRYSAIAVKSFMMATTSVGIMAISIIIYYIWR